MLTIVSPLTNTELDTLRGAKLRIILHPAKYFKLFFT